MMKKFLLALLAVVIVAVGWYFIYTHPKHINESLLGVEYRSGQPNVAVKPVTVQINGTLEKSIRGILTFEGTIKLKGNSRLNPDNNRPLTIPFNGPGGMGWMVYGYWKKDGTPVNHGYAPIFINAGFSEVSILETNSLTITAPASNRSQAVSISNALMKGWLKGDKVK